MSVRWRHSWFGWLGAAVLVGYVAATSDLEAFVRTVAAADPWRFLLASLIAGPVAFTLDALGTHALLRAVGLPLPFRDAARLRGASYLLNIVNYHLGLAAVAAVLARRTGRKGAEAVGLVLALGLMDLWALAAIAMAGLASGAVELPDPYGGLVTGVAACGVVGGPIFWIAVRRLGTPRGLPAFVAEVVATLRRMRAAPAAGAALLRVGMVAAFVVSDWNYLLAFRFDVPAWTAVAWLPVVYLVSALPVSVGGFGAGQVAMRWVFAGWAPAGGAVAAAASVDAVSTCAFSMVLAMRLVVGLTCLPWALGALRGAVRPGPRGDPAA